MGQVESQQPQQQQQHMYDYDSMPLNERRRHYNCHESFTVLEYISTWSRQAQTCLDRINILIGRNQENGVQRNQYQVNHAINNKVSLIQADITALEIDAIVNPSRTSLEGVETPAGTCHNAIYIAGGWQLEQACRNLQGCDVGEAKITSGFALPAKRVIHCPGPSVQSQNKDVLLQSCYRNSLEAAKIHGNINIRSLAFPCISTGSHGFSRRDAAHIALDTCRQWLEENYQHIDRIIFCTHTLQDYEIYLELMAKYFPLGDEVANDREEVFVDMDEVAMDRDEDAVDTGLIIDEVNRENDQHNLGGGNKQPTESLDHSTIEEVGQLVDDYYRVSYNDINEEREME